MAKKFSVKRKHPGFCSRARILKKLRPGTLVLVTGIPSYRVHGVSAMCDEDLALSGVVLGDAGITPDTVIRSARVLVGKTITWAHYIDADVYSKWHSGLDVTALQIPCKPYIVIAYQAP